MADALKPCPFCGADLVEESSTGLFYHPIVSNDRCIAEGFGGIWAEVRGSLWNRRSIPSPETVGRLKALEQDLLAQLEDGVWGVKDSISDLRWNRQSTMLIRDSVGPLLRDLLREIEGK